MLLPKKSNPGDNLSVVAKRLDALIDYVVTATRITVSPEMSLRQSASGISIGVKPQQQQSAGIVTPATSAGGLVELHREWTDAIYSWRENERVVYKPSGSAYYIVYECNDPTATSTDVPGTSSKWTKITNWVDEAYWLAATAYTTGNKVLYLGAIYTAAAGSTGVVPGTNAAVWTKTCDSLIGITAYPMQIDSVDVYTPYAEYYQYDVKYDLTPDADTNKLYFGQRRIEHYLDGTVKITPANDLVDWAPTIKHE